MGLEPEGDSTAVWRHLPADTEKEKPVIRMRMKRNVPDTQESQNALGGFTINTTQQRSGFLYHSGFSIHRELSGYRLWTLNS